MWYALQVATGQEIEIWHRIEAEAWKNAVPLKKVLACAKHVMRLDDKTSHSYERVIPSYIFVCLHGGMTNAVYQFLRYLPGVFKVFYESPLTTDEIRRVFALIEGEVEVPAEKVAAFSRTALMQQYHRFKEKVAKQPGINILFRRMRSYIRLLSSGIKNAICQLSTASQPDLLTLICLLVT